ncbi:hypothetical protein N7466_003636 [Penicillium verhagenii]|uniref:uncharacterized protein n=1 Tax=Penicillium verhagenii TaxID=1562060 RepID=UPI002545B5CF|nr:uncharacterized protein N7466_003636 [Penicillium verhagenii]KAJ5934089.1 hypothetical protein N7466_003636 [Penicillium verhagenii]
MDEKVDLSPKQGATVPVNGPASMVDEKPRNDQTDPELLDALDRPQRIHQIVQEAILLAGGAVAILLQVAEPGVGKGVDRHSNFAYRPLDRLRTTMTYIYCMAYGTRAEKKSVIEMVHRAHAPVKGPSYSANDPRLQLWVAATLYAVGIDLYQRVFGPMSQETAEEIYQEYSILATSLRVPAGMWPATRAAFWQYWDDKIATVEITDNAKNVAHDLLWNKKAPLQIRAVLPIVRLTTAEMLPPRIRDAYGLKSTKVRRGTYRVLMGLTRVTYPALPRVIRTYPMRYYLKDMRRRINNMS